MTNEQMAITVHKYAVAARAMQVRIAELAEQMESDVAEHGDAYTHCKYALSTAMAELQDLDLLIWGDVKMLLGITLEQERAFWAAAGLDDMAQDGRSMRT